MTQHMFIDGTNADQCRSVAKAYVFLDVRPERQEHAARMLRAMPGVRTVGVVDGPPDLVVMTEAPTHQEMVRKTIAAIIAVEDDIIVVRCLRVRSEEAADGAK